MADSGAYDPGARRDTPLARKLKDRIRRDGPIAVADYMRACLQDTDHGYYVKRPAIGAAGDFVTAPEISQIFGELLGLWSAVVWQQMGSPERFNLIELGPGRGTLMRDALRAARRVPGFVAAAELHLVEVGSELRRLQASTLAEAGLVPTWHADLADVPPAPSIVIANEFIDALPVEQLVRGEAGWRRRTVELDTAERLVFGLDAGGPVVLPPGGPIEAEAGAILEHRVTTELASSLARLAAAGPLAALIIDYGHAGAAIGDTLQAVRRHHYEHPLTSPGEADLTALVEFTSLADAALSLGLATDGPATQAELLGALGIMERASRLMAANPTKAARIEADVARLMSPSGMGTRFKALGLRSRGMPVLPGFPTVDIARRTP